jgi:hypothetical protein
VSWRTVKNILFANWKEKLLSVLMAILFWFMIKAQINRSSLPFGDRAPRTSRL